MGKFVAMGLSTGCIFLSFILFSLFTVSKGTVRRNSEPINVGFIFSIPYDISNTLRAPLGGPLSLLLGSALALIMFFGMLATPLFYLFGIPPRPYHIRDAAKTNNTEVLGFFDRSFHDDEFIFNEGLDFISINSSKTKLPQFIPSAFLLIPVADENCQLLMICHAHGFLKMLPQYFLKFYSFFSKKITGGGDVESAVVTGFIDQALCSQKYNKCSVDMGTIGKMTFNSVSKTIYKSLKYISQYSNLGSYAE